MKSTLLNVVCVVAGSLLGLALGQFLPPNLQKMGFQGIGLIVLGLGISMFLKGKNPLVTTASIILGGLFGALIGVDNILAGVGEMLRGFTGGSGTFTEGFVTATVLFCVGPMTILGCLEEGLQKRSQLLETKSILDGFSSVFFAATLGVGVLFSALSVLVIQGVLTFSAARLEFLKDDPDVIAEISATGGVIVLGLGFGLLQIVTIPVANFLPALLFAALLFYGHKRLISIPAPPIG